MVDKLDNVLEEIDEVIGLQNIIEIIKTRPLKLYWGTTPSRLPHFLYLIPLIKISKFVKNNMNIIILLADIHAYLDSIKSNFDVLSHRTDIHENIIKILLRYLNTNMDFIKFVQGTSFQLNSSYTLDMYKFNAITRVSDVIKAGKNAVVQSKDPLMTSLLYPTLQALDIEYLDADIYFGDSNQREICLLSDSIAEKMSFRKKCYFLNDINENFKQMEKITFIDHSEMIKQKINNTPNNVLILLLNEIIFEICEIKNISFEIGNIKFKTIEEIKEKYKSKQINMIEIKESIIKFIDEINESIREEYLEDDAKYKLILANYI